MNDWRIEGVIPLLQTPFFETGTLDLESLRREVEAALEAGADALGYPGFVSEWWKLEPEEIDAAAAVILDRCSGRAPVILNVTAQSTVAAVKHAQRFADMGASGLMCLPPFAVPSGPEAILGHLEAVMEATRLPFVFQYSPSLTGTRLDPSIFRRLRESHPQFACVKVDFIPTGPAVTEIREALADEGVTYLIGFAGLQLADSMARGATGLMDGAGHIAEDVRVFRALRKAMQTGGEDAWKEALDQFHRLLPLINLEMQTIGVSIALHKEMLYRLGIIQSPHVRKPGAELDRFQKQELDHILARLPK